jgi:hypothetical protein
VRGQSLTPVQRDLLLRANTGATVGAAIESSPHPDGQAAEALCTFISGGVIVAIAADSGKVAAKN